LPPPTIVANELLQGLPRKELQILRPRLELVSLPLHAVLNAEGKRIEYGYFMNGGLASVLTVLKSGKIVEVGLSGAEGFVGLPLVAGLRSSGGRVIVQVAGSGYRIAAREMIVVLKRCPVLERRLQRYAQEVAGQAAQIAACNRLHNANQRLARWLLMSQDRMKGDFVNLTQEFLAHMLGMRRASVSVALGHLHKAGMVTYARGRVEIVDRARLEAAACECYATINERRRAWLNESR
jgi:CRP-like cAMP-binding protein